jgi:CheY-like chemotaxis protein
LRKAGYEVQLASNSVDAWEFLSQNPYDIVISDLSQESTEAIALLSRSRESSATEPVPFIFLTRDGQVEEKKRALEAGASELIDRPIYAKEFLIRIRLLLQKQNRSRMEGTSEHGAFSGALADLGVVDLLQTLERGHKTGVITIESDNRQGELYVRNGRVIDASLGRLRGEDAVYRMFLWTDGVYSGEFKNVRHEENIKLSSQGLVLEGMRRLEEWTRLLDGLPPVQHICEVDYPALAEHLGELPDEVNAVLRLFDGHRSLLQVIDDADFGAIETLTILGKLYAEGILYDTVQKPTRVKGSIPSLELERWLSGLPPILEAGKEAPEALPSPSEVSSSESSTLAGTEPPVVTVEPGLAIKIKQPLAEAPVPTPLPSHENLQVAPLQENQPEPVKNTLFDVGIKQLEPIQVEPVAAEVAKAEAKPQEEKKAPKEQEEEKAPSKRSDEDHDSPKPRSVAAPTPDEDDDILPPLQGSGNTMYYVLAAAVAVVVLFFVFSGGKDKTKKPVVPPKSAPVEVPIAEPVASSSVPASTSAPTSTSIPAVPTFPVVLTPEQKKQYDDTVSLGNDQYTDAKYDEAIATYRKALSIDPYGNKALRALGNVLYDKGYFAFTDNKEPEVASQFLEESIQILELAAEKHPDDAIIQVTLANVYEYRSREKTKSLTKTLTEDRLRAKLLYELYLKLDPTGASVEDANAGLAALKKLIPKTPQPSTSPNSIPSPP